VAEAGAVAPQGAVAVADLEAEVAVTASSAAKKATLAESAPRAAATSALTARRKDTFRGSAPRVVAGAEGAAVEAVAEAAAALLALAHRRTRKLPLETTSLENATVHFTNKIYFWLMFYIVPTDY